MLVAGAVLAAAVLSSLAPPPPAFAQEGSALARVGPGKVAQTVNLRGGYTLQVLVDPNKAVQSNSFALRLSRDGKPVTGADITLTFGMLDMQMPSLEYQLAETAPGIYTRKASALVMVGHWGLTFAITPKGGQPFTATVVDHATG